MAVEYPELSTMPASTNMSSLKRTPPVLRICTGATWPRKNTCSGKILLVISEALRAVSVPAAAPATANSRTVKITTVSLVSIVDRFISLISFAADSSAAFGFGMTSSRRPGALCLADNGKDNNTGPQSSARTCPLAVEAENASGKEAAESANQSKDARVSVQRTDANLGHQRNARNFRES